MEFPVSYFYVCFLLVGPGKDYQQNPNHPAVSEIPAACPAAESGLIKSRTTIDDQPS